MILTHWLRRHEWAFTCHADAAKSSLSSAWVSGGFWRAVDVIMEFACGDDSCSGKAVYCLV